MNAPRGGDQACYVGWRAFTDHDSEHFFGRVAECTALRELLIENPVVIMHGPAGSGKTSMLQAGLLPQLRDDCLVLPPGRVSDGSFFPEAALAGHNPYTLAVLSGWSPADSRASLAPLSLTDFLTQPTLTSGLPGAGTGRIFAIIDQFEEIFDDAAAVEQRAAFFADLAAALQTEPGLRVVLCIRDDHLDDLQAYQELLSLRPEAHFFLGPLSPTAALVAVQGPAEQAGYQFAPGVAEHIVDTLAVAGQVEPVQLQVVCAALLHSLPSGMRTIRLDAPAISSLAERALAQFCSAALAHTAAEHDISVAELRHWVQRNLITPAGTRAAVTADPAVLGQPVSILHGLASLHLLTPERHPDGTRHYRLASDRLVVALQYPGGSAQPEAPPGITPAAHLRIAADLTARRELALAEKHAWYALDGSADQDLRLRINARSVLGNLAYEGGHFAEAEAHYQQAAELSEQLQDQVGVGRLLGAIGQLHALQGHYAAALEDLQSAVARVPGDLVLQTDLANVLWRAGQARAAVAVFGTVLTVEPDFAEALAGRGQISAENGNASSALDDLRALQRLRPSLGRQPELRSAYALALARTGRPDTAMAEADAALASAPDNGLIFLRAARVARASGALDRASALLERAAQANSPALSDEQLDEARRLLNTASGPDT